MQELYIEINSDKINKLKEIYFDKDKLLDEEINPLLAEKLIKLSMELKGKINLSEVNDELQQIIIDNNSFFDFFKYENNEYFKYLSFDQFILDTLAGN